MRTLPAGLLVWVVGCTPEPVVTAPTAPAVSAIASATASATAPAPASAWEPGQVVVARGRVSTTPWQHVMSGVAGKKSAYLDLEGGKRQTVIYWVEPPKCSAEVEVTGRVLEVRGDSKRPGGQPTKSDDTWRELHIDVDSARCVD